MHPAGHAAELSVEASRSHVGVEAATEVQPAGHASELSVAASKSQVSALSVAVPVQVAATSVAVPVHVVAPQEEGDTHAAEVVANVRVHVPSVSWQVASLTPAHTPAPLVAGRSPQPRPPPGSLLR